MGALSLADRSTGSAEPVEKLAGGRATDAGARSLCAGWLSGAAFGGERR